MVAKTSLSSAFFRACEAREQIFDRQVTITRNDSNLRAGYYKFLVFR